MYENITKPLSISKELNKKIEFICRFACVKYELLLVVLYLLIILI